MKSKTQGQPFPVRVWSLDVWGNEKDGYQVNDRSERAVKMCTAEIWNGKKTLIQWLKKALDDRGNRAHTDSFTIDGDRFHRYIDYKGRPLFELEVTQG